MLVFIGTYTDPILMGTGQIFQGKGRGIHVYRLDEASGSLEPAGVTSGIRNPSYLAFDPSHRFLYAVNELKEYEGRPGGAVSAFAVEPASGGLRFLNRQPTHGADPCHVAVDGRRQHVFVANYSGGSVCVLPLGEDGSLGAASDFVQHLGAGIDPARQTGPHVHSVTLDLANRFAFVADLGLDKLMAYRFDPGRGMLEPNAVPWIKMKPGAGPRHMAFHPDGGTAYLVNELDSTIAVLDYDPAAGEFCLVQVLSSLPARFDGANAAAAIEVSPSGQFAYVSNRGHDSIAIYRIDPLSGRLTLHGHQPCGGAGPRSFAIDPGGRFLVVANQDSDSVTTFRIDPLDGMLEPAGPAAAVPTPVCVKFL